MTIRDNSDLGGGFTDEVDAINDIIEELVGDSSGRGEHEPEVEEAREWKSRPGEATAGDCDAKSNAPTDNGAQSLLMRADARRFNPDRPPAKAEPRIFINQRGVCTPGNISNLIAQAKAGKSAVVGGVISAVMVADKNVLGRDTLGISAVPPQGKRLIHFDTEQSAYDHNELVRRSMTRAVAAPPEWLESYSLAGFASREVRSLLPAILARAAGNGGVFAVIIDGAADMVSDVNDATECNAFVAELHELAIKYDCPILSVVHENPGQDFGKMRGHLGSQLERKGESNLRLKKADEVTVLFSEKMRRAPILEKEGPRFAWCDHHGMHMSVSSKSDAKAEAKRVKQQESAEAVFHLVGKAEITYTELLQALRKIHQVTASTAEDRFCALRDAGIITKAPSGAWMLSPTANVAP